MNYNPEDIIPARNKVLIQPGPIKMLKQEISTPDPKKNIGKKSTQIHKMDMKEYEVKAVYRPGKVLRAGEDSPYREGDFVIFNIGSQFDLMTAHTPNERCPMWVDMYSVYATLSKEWVAKFETKFNDYVKGLQSETSGE